MDGRIAVLSLAAGYLIGAISFSRIVSRRVAPGADVTRLDETPGAAGPGGPLEIASATTVGIKLGSRYGMLTAILDILKVFIPAMALKLLYPGQPYFLMQAVAGMVGHIWPVYYRFRGGRGMSAAYGGMLAVDPVGMLVTWLLGTILGFLARNPFVLFMGGVWLFIPWVWLVWRDVSYVLFAVAVNLIFILALVPEVRTYMREQRAGRAASFEEAMEFTPMGKGLLKMARRLGLVKPPPPG